MDFSYTEEQGMLEDSVNRFIKSNYTLDQRKIYAGCPEGFQRENWQSYADMGWLMLPFSEEDGGIGGGPVEMMIMMEAFGRGLVLEPYLSTVVLAGGLLKRAGNDSQKKEYLSRIQEGVILMAFAYAEKQSRFNLSDVTTCAEVTDDGFKLHGHKIVVVHGNTADMLMVTARTAGEQRDREGVSLFMIDSMSEGVKRVDYRTVDGLKASEIAFDNVSIPSSALIGELNQGIDVIEPVVDEAILAVSSEALGAMEMLYKGTIEYLKERVQFGQPLSKFQALQHRMVDMFVEYEQSKSLLYLTVAKMEEGAPDTSKWISALKAKIGEAGRLIGQQAIQLHGGMGMTDELNIGHYFKRLMVIETLFGNSDYHLQRFCTYS